MTLVRPLTRGLGVEPPEMPEPVQVLPYQHAITCGVTGVPYPDYVNDGKDKTMCFGPDWMFADLVSEKESSARMIGILIGAVGGLVAGVAVGVIVGGGP
jgi:hypothetical protein